MNWFKPGGDCSCCQGQPCLCPGSIRYLNLDYADPNANRNIVLHVLTIEAGVGARYYKISWTYPISLSIELPEATCDAGGFVSYQYPGAEIEMGLAQAPFLHNKCSVDTRGSEDFPGAGIKFEEYTDYTFTNKIIEYQFDLKFRPNWETYLIDGVQQEGFICNTILIDWVASVTGGISNELPEFWNNPANASVWFLGINKDSAIHISSEGPITTPGDGEWQQAQANFDSCGPVSIRNLNETLPDGQAIIVPYLKLGVFEDSYPIDENGNMDFTEYEGVPRIYRWSIVQYEL